MNLNLSALEREILERLLDVGFVHFAGSISDLCVSETEDFVLARTTSFRVPKAQLEFAQELSGGCYFLCEKTSDVVGVDWCLKGTALSYLDVYSYDSNKLPTSLREYTLHQR